VIQTSKARTAPKRIEHCIKRGPLRDMYHPRRRNVIAELIIPVMNNNKTFFLAKS